MSFELPESWNHNNEIFQHHSDKILELLKDYGKKTDINPIMLAIACQATIAKILLQFYSQCQFVFTDEPPKDETGED